MKTIFILHVALISEGYEYDQLMQFTDRDICERAALAAMKETDDET